MGHNSVRSLCMRQKPWILVVLAWLHILAPLGTMMLNAAWANRSLSEHVRLFFLPHNFVTQWPHLVLPVVAGFAIWACKKWSFALYFVCIMGLCAVSYVGYQQMGTQIGVSRLLLLYGFNLAVVSYFLLPAVRKVYLDPRLRWWESSPRYRLGAQAAFRVGEIHGVGTVENVSKTGLLIMSNLIPKDQAMIDVDLPFAEETYQLSGRVVHHGSQSSVGFGIRFVLDSQKKRRLSQLIELLKHQAVRERLPEPGAGFRSWLRSALRGKELLPVPDSQRRATAQAKKELDPPSESA